jgi:hypothetical protein
VRIRIKVKVRVTVRLMARDRVKRGAMLKVRAHTSMEEEKMS